MHARVRTPDKPSPVLEWNRSVGPFVHFAPPVPFEEQLHDKDPGWKVLWNPRTLSYEYVAIWRKHEAEPEVPGQWEGSEDGSVGTPPGPSAEQTPPRVELPWKKGMKVTRAEDLPPPPPPPPEFVTEAGDIRNDFSSRYFSVPYYSEDQRKFVYTDPQDNLINLSVKAGRRVKLPVFVPRRRPKVRPNPPVDPKASGETIIDFRYAKSPWSRHLVEIHNSQDRCGESARKTVSVRKNFMFPDISEEPEIPETPCPLPRKKPGKGAPEPKIRPKDTIGCGLPTESSVEIEGDHEAFVILPEGQPDKVDEKKKKKNRRRRNSDPTYRTEGLREEKKKEKEDLKWMLEEERKGKRDEHLKRMCEEDERRRRTEEALERFIRYREGLERQQKAGEGEVEDEDATKRRIAKGKQKSDEYHKQYFELTQPLIRIEEEEEEEEEESIYSKPKFVAGLYPNRVNRRPKGGDSDDEYIPFKDHEEELQEQKDIQEMHRRVEQEYEPVPEDTVKVDDPKTPQTSSIFAKNMRKKIPIEDRTYQPGHGLPIRRGHPYGKM
ncbi:hypothetical protein ABW19_dt0207201 [Dactylella cylindrospora]|nr:hypothetical protein ABW19_dt0207201 [Dactylella cylindrospora]